MQEYGAFKAVKEKIPVRRSLQNFFPIGPYGSLIRQ